MRCSANDGDIARRTGSKRLATTCASTALVLISASAIATAAIIPQADSQITEERAESQTPTAVLNDPEGSSGASVTAAAVGSKFLLVSSFECTIPGCNYENAVLRYDGSSGAFLGVHTSNVPGAYGMAIHPRTGRLLIVSRDNNQVTEHDARTGAYLRTLITAGNTGLNAPQNILFNAAGNILITSIPVTSTPDAVNGILEFDGNTGAFLRVFVDGGAINPLFPEDCGDPRCLRGANGMAFAINANGSLGNLYVASSVNDLILEYNGTTGAYVGVFDSSRLVSPNGLLVRTGTLRPGNLVVTSTWDNPNLTNDFQKIVEFDKNTRELITTNSGVLASGIVYPGPLRWHLDTTVNPPLLRMLVGIRLSTVSATSPDRVVMRTEAGTTHVRDFTPSTDPNLHIPTAMLHIAYGWATCDADGDNDVDLKDIAAYHLCRTSPTSTCLGYFDDDLTGNLSTYDFQVCVSKAAGPPFPCTSSAQCNDANACTTDTCSSGTCIFQVRPDNTSCADASFCDGAEVCRGGVCSAPIPCVDTAHCDETNDRCRACINNAECNDNNVCTTDTCNLNTGCVYTAASGSCNDGNACTVNDACSAGVCLGGGPRNCNDNNVCTDDSCDTAIGCLHVHNLNPCNDNSICTLEDFCLLGTCRGTNPIDCNDGEQCTTDFCHPVQGCQNTNSNLACDDHDDCTESDVCSNGVCNGVPADCDDGIDCTDDACVDGVCVNTPNNGLCADNLFCNGTETCSPVNGCVSSGNPCSNGPVCQNTCIEATDSCLSPQGTPCTNDGNPCTNDVCNGNGQCGVPNTNACNDSNACTSNDTCGNGVCAGAPIQCNDSNPCTDDTCNPATGCVFTPNNNNGCGDLNACNGQETCSGGTCIAGSPLVCNDSNPCTNDSCVAATGCSFVPSTANSCSDSNACNGLETCTAQGTCQAGTALTCNDNNPCTDDSCAPATGCVFTNDNSNLCADSNLCNGNETCAGGVCQAGTPLICNDNNPCTDDSCVPATGCGFTDDNTNLCADSNLCNGNETCASGACQPGTPLTCNDDNPCTDDSCAPATGCVFTNDNFNVCADADPCDGEEVCVAGACQAGTPIGCDDGVDCTVDQCAAGVGCQNVPNDALCDDSNDCTDDFCDPEFDCQFDPLDQPCDDGEFCTVSDFCVAGQCVGEPREDCDDGNPCNGVETCSGTSCQPGTPVNCSQAGDQCNNASCDPQGGPGNCDILTPKPNNTVCDDGVFCTVSDTCFDGVCDGNPRNCDDGNPCDGEEFCVGSSCQEGTPVNCSQAGDQCNDASCDTQGGPGNCDILTPKPNNTACDDGDPCTLGDACQGGACIGGSGPDCSGAGDDCNDASCDTQGAPGNCDILTPKPNNTPCQDGLACTVGESCQGGSCTGGGAPDCTGEGDQCNNASCDTQGGPANCDILTPKPNNTTCDDGDPCTLGDACQGGACIGGSGPDCSGAGDDCNDASCDTQGAPGNCDILTPKPNNTPCQDGLACTVGDTCQNGACTSGGAPNCESDGDQCNDASCDPMGAPGNCDILTPIANGVSCVDGDPCTEGESCQEGDCVGGNPPNCFGVGDPQCQVATCDPGGPDGNCNNVTNVDDGTPCNDSVECTINDQCISGVCQGTPDDCP